MTAKFRAFAVLVECSLEFGRHEAAVGSKQTVVAELMIETNSIAATQLSRRQEFRRHFAPPRNDVL
jgi:hypothetical protein